MARKVTVEELRARLGRALDALRLDAGRCAEHIDYLDHLEDSIAALEARNQRDRTVAWDVVRGS